MPRIYTCEFENIAVTTAVDMFIFDPAAERPIELIGLFISQHTEVTTNVGRDEFMRMRIIRGHTTAGTGTSATPVPIEPIDVAAGFTCVTNATTSTAGTAVNVHSEAWNVRTGFGMIWPADSGPQTTGTSLLVVRLMAAPSESISFSGTTYIREL